MNGRTLLYIAINTMAVINALYIVGSRNDKREFRQTNASIHVSDDNNKMLYRYVRTAKQDTRNITNNYNFSGELFHHVKSNDGGHYGRNPTHDDLVLQKFREVRRLKAESNEETHVNPIRHRYKRNLESKKNLDAKKLEKELLQKTSQGRENHDGSEDVRRAREEHVNRLYKHILHRKKNDRFYTSFGRNNQLYRSIAQCSTDECVRRELEKDNMVRITDDNQKEAKTTMPSTQAARPKEIETAGEKERGLELSTTLVSTELTPPRSMLFSTGSSEEGSPLTQPNDVIVKSTEAQESMNTAEEMENQLSRPTKDFNSPESSSILDKSDNELDAQSSASGNQFKTSSDRMKIFVANRNDGTRFELLTQSGGNNPEGVDTEGEDVFNDDSDLRINAIPTGQEFSQDPSNRLSTRHLMLRRATRRTTTTTTEWVPFANFTFPFKGVTEESGQTSSRRTTTTTTEWDPFARFTFPKKTTMQTARPVATEATTTEIQLFQIAVITEKPSVTHIIKVSEEESDEFTRGTSPKTVFSTMGIKYVSIPSSEGGQMSEVKQGEQKSVTSEVQSKKGPANTTVEAQTPDQPTQFSTVSNMKEEPSAATWSNMITSAPRSTTRMPKSVNVTVLPTEYSTTDQPSSESDAESSFQTNSVVTATKETTELTEEELTSTETVSETIAPSPNSTTEVFYTENNTENVNCSGDLTEASQISTDSGPVSSTSVTDFPTVEITQSDSTTETSTPITCASTSTGDREFENNNCFTQGITTETTSASSQGTSYTTTEIKDVITTTDTPGNKVMTSTTASDLTDDDTFADGVNSTDIESSIKTTYLISDDVTMENSKPTTEAVMEPSTTPRLGPGDASSDEEIKENYEFKAPQTADLITESSSLTPRQAITQTNSLENSFPLSYSTTVVPEDSTITTSRPGFEAVKTSSGDVTIPPTELTWETESTPHASTMKTTFEPLMMEFNTPIVKTQLETGDLHAPMENGDISDDTSKPTAVGKRIPLVSLQQQAKLYENDVTDDDHLTASTQEVFSSVLPIATEDNTTIEPTLYQISTTTETGTISEATAAEHWTITSSPPLITTTKRSRPAPFGITNPVSSNSESTVSADNSTESPAEDELLSSDLQFQAYTLAAENFTSPKKFPGDQTMSEEHHTEEAIENDPQPHQKPDSKSSVHLCSFFEKGKNATFTFPMDVDIEMLTTPEPEASGPLRLQDIEVSLKLPQKLLKKIQVCATRVQNFSFPGIEIDVNIPMRYLWGKTSDTNLNKENDQRQIEFNVNVPSAFFSASNNDRRKAPKGFGNLNIDVSMTRKGVMSAGERSLSMDVAPTEPNKSQTTSGVTGPTKRMSEFTKEFRW